jgi:short-subunit dehydrogenase
MLCLSCWVILVVSAGYFHECAVSVFQQQMQLNYMGSLHAVKAVYNDMVSRNSGHICFIGSAMSLLGETAR